MTLKQLLEHYLDHRREVITRRTRYLLQRARQRAHILEGLILAVGDIDAIIELIKSSADPDEAKRRLMERPLRLSESADGIRISGEPIPWNPGTAGWKIPWRRSRVSLSTASTGPAKTATASTLSASALSKPSMPPTGHARTLALA